MNLPCPTCQKDVPWSQESPDRPFCSPRCKLIDLGEWCSEGYKVPSEEKPWDDEAGNH